MNIVKAFALSLVAAVTLAACAGPAAQSPNAPLASQEPTVVAGQQIAAATVKTMDHPNLGTILVDANGMTLYRYSNDQMNVSNCTATCAQNWPPLTMSARTPILAAGTPGTLGTLAREDGSTQVTYNGMPLYYFVKDTSSGETNGQGVNGVWFVVEPQSAPYTP